MLRRFPFHVHRVGRLYSTAIDRWVSNVVTERIELASGKLELKTGHMARFASGSVTLSSGNSTILATVVTSDFDADTPSTSLPGNLALGVDFLQSASAVGRIPMNYLRRELQQNDMDILLSRMIDRSIRPLIPKYYTAPIKVVCKPLSLDRNVDLRVLGINAASAAMALSSIPMLSNVAACRVAMIGDEVVLNPQKEQLEESSIDLLLSGTSDQKVVMIEMDGKQVSLDDFMHCIDKGFHEINTIINSIESLSQKAGKEKKMLNPGDDAKMEEIIESLIDISQDRLNYILTDVSHDKSSRDSAINELRKEAIEALEDDFSEKDLNYCFGILVKYTMRQMARNSGLRVDGRTLDEIRPIFIQTDVYPKLHGSAIFQRGQSQVMGTVTFDSLESSFRPDAVAQLLGAQQRKSFMVHYEFPAFAVNQVSESSARFNRRSLGHGNLAEKALKHVIPKHFPYCIRLDCQVLESNGSTSMASACVGSLALFDAGVGLETPVSGIAIGLFHDDGEIYKPEDAQSTDPIILTDLMGMEDYAGDMDCKVAGTSKGFTAMQLDVSIPGISTQLLKESMLKGRSGLDNILRLMNKELPKARSEFKSSVPVMETITLLGAQRSVLFRSNAYNAKLIGAETGAQFFTEDEEKITLMAPSRNDLENAKKMMKDIFEERDDEWPEYGKMLDTEIVEVLERAVMIKLPKVRRPIKVPLRSLTIQQVSTTAVLNLKVGQKIRLKYLGMDPSSGHPRLINLGKMI